MKSTRGSGHGSRFRVAAHRYPARRDRFPHRGNRRSRSLEWSTPSLCQGWTVGDVAAHLTHSTMRCRGCFWRRRAAVSGSMPSCIGWPSPIVGRLRRSPPTCGESSGHDATPLGTTMLDPLTDVLVHAQDICIPLGIDREMPGDAAVAAAERVWHMGFPSMRGSGFPEPGSSLSATSRSTAGDGREIRAPIRELLLLLTGRPARIPESGSSGGIAAGQASRSGEHASTRVGVTGSSVSPGTVASDIRTRATHSDASATSVSGWNSPGREPRSGTRPEVGKVGDELHTHTRAGRERLGLLQAQLHQQRAGVS